jgi:hypothetical protein
MRTHYQFDDDHEIDLTPPRGESPWIAAVAMAGTAILGLGAWLALVLL